MIKKKTFFPAENLPLIILVISLFALPVRAEKDPNPNSPTPILISQADSTRARARSADRFKRKTFRQKSNRVFRLNQKVKLYLTNVELMPGEGAKAFRVYARDAKNKIYRFPVLDLQPLRGQSRIFELTFLLKNEFPAAGQPTETGDILLNVTWRGLASNQVRLGLGKTGGKLIENKSSKPTPINDFIKKPVENRRPLQNKKYKRFIQKEVRTSEYVGYRFAGDRRRFMEQATFGPTEKLDLRLRRIGLRTWLAEQFEMPYPSAENPYPDIPLKSSDPNNEVNGCGVFENGTDEYIMCRLNHYTMFPLQTWFFREAFYGKAQLRHRVAWALQQLWVTSGISVRQSRHMIEYHRILSRNAFGNYRDLMKEVTLSPTMGDYLDMARSTKDAPNENYPREILQLFTVGTFMLNRDGTFQLDENGNPIPTYTQDTINHLTKVLTGWSFCNDGNNPQCPNASPGTVNFIDPLILDESQHNTEAKTLLSYPDSVNENLPASQSGDLDLEQALDNIFYHPNVAPFVSRFLIQRLVRSDPTPAYVERVANIFADNGIGVRGDLKAVVRAILLDPEARGDEKTALTYGKLREPVLFVTNIARHFDVLSADRTVRSDGGINGMIEDSGQSTFYAPTVFNYYPPDFVIPGTSVNAPEFGIMNTETAINRYNLVHLLVYESRPGGTIHYPLGTSIDLTGLESLSEADPSGGLLVDELDKKLLYKTMPEGMRSSILNSLSAVSESDHKRKVQNAVYLVLTSSQFQIQR